MSSYNHKINSDGTYRNFYGWSIISMAVSDMKFIENFLNNSSYLKQFYSPLSSSSYHMTIYNLWYNGSPLLNHQQRILNRNYSDEMIDFLVEESKKIGESQFNPGNCMNELLYKLSFYCNKVGRDITNEFKQKKITLTIKNVYIGETIGIEFESCDILDFLNTKKRPDFIKIAERDDKLGLFHMTLAYKYCSLTSNHKNEIINIKKEIELLDCVLKNQTITFDFPNVYSFNSMTHFSLFDEN
jgi:hypothetical protein